MASVRASFSLDQAVPGTDGGLTYHDIVGEHGHKPKWSRHLPRTTDKVAKVAKPQTFAPADDGLLVLVRVVLPKSLNLKGPHTMIFQGRSVDEAIAAFHAMYPHLPSTGTRTDEGVEGRVHNWTLRVKAPASYADKLATSVGRTLK